MGRLGARLWIFVALGIGCDRPAPAPSATPGVSDRPRPAAAATVSTREDFLEVLAPLPYETLRIGYAVTGPAGIRGTLEIAARPGGFRHERWSLRLPTDDGDVPLEGVRIQTPDGIWSDGIEGVPQVRASPLGALADAFVALPSARQTRVLARLADWHEALARGRAENPGQRDAVLDVSCLLTRVGGHELCVWETVGLPLRYRGGAFEVVAQEIHRDDALPDDLFVFPDHAAHDTASTRQRDPQRTLQSLEAGDYAELALLLQPTLRLPQDTSI